MPHEAIITGVILKKQPMGEADELITFYTKETGKVRALAKSSKLAKSKLAHALQPASMVSVTLASQSKLPKIIHAQIIDIYPALRENPEAVRSWFVVAESILKATPDEQKNESLFEALYCFLRFLDSSNASISGAIDAGLIKFKIEFLEALGFGVWQPATPGVVPNHFSNSSGGFIAEKNSGSDAYPIDSAVWQAFIVLRNCSWNDIPTAPGVSELQRLLSSFVEYQLEREIKAEKF